MTTHHPMARLSLVAALLFLFAFVRQDDPKQLIARTWRVADASVPSMVEETANRLKQQNPGAEDEVEANRPQLEAVVRGVRATFHADGTFTGIVPGQPDQTGTWTLSADGKTLTRTYPGRTSTDQVVRLSKTELVLKREGRPETTYTPAE